MGTKRAIPYWVIPPEADGEFAAHGQGVWEVCSRPYDSQVLMLCMDEQPAPLVEEVKTPIAENKKHPWRADYEYRRAGMANLFLFAEPLALLATRFGSRPKALSRLGPRGGRPGGRP
jgi:hypothetical protein